MKPIYILFIFALSITPICKLQSQTKQKENASLEKNQGLNPSENQAYRTFRKNLIIQPELGVQAKTNSSTCSSNSFQNIGFEQGNFSGWNLQKGIILNSLYDSIVNLAPITTTYNMMSGGTDALTGLSLSSPFTGSFVIMLNDQYNNVEATQLNTKFRVTPSNTILKTAFSVILQKAYHECAGQPYFRIQLFSCSRNTLIGEYLIMGNEGVCEGYNTSLFKWNAQDNSIHMATDWKKACFDLRNYIGEEVELNVIVADCKYAGHYAYAFFDAEFGTLAPSYATATSFSVNAAPFNFISGVNYQCFSTGSLLQCQTASSILFPNASGTNTCVTTNSVALIAPGYYNIIQTPVIGCDFLNEQFIPVQPTVSISASNNTVCPNTPYGYTLSGAKEYTIEINGIPSYTVLSPNITAKPISLTLQQNPSTITVIGSGGPINCQHSVSLVVPVYPETTLTTVYSPTVCAGMTTLSANGAITYTWNSVAAYTQTYVTSVAANTMFYVQGTDAMGCKTAMSNFTVQGIFGTSISNFLSNYGSICEGDSVLCGFFGATSFTWSNGFGGGNQYLKPTVSAPNYTVSATALCSSTQTYTLNFNVWQGPAVTSFTVNHPNSPICPGSSFTVQGLGTNFYFHYGNVSGNTNFGSYFANPNYTVFTAVAQSTNGCGTTSLIPITFLASPTLAITGNTNVCQGQVTTFTSSGANTYTWDYTQSGNTYTTLASNSNYSVSLYGVGLNGCFSNSVFPVSVENMPITASSNSANVCIGSNTLTLTAKPFLSTGTYSWSTGASSQSINVSPTISTIYTLTTNSALCGIKISTISISVNPNTVTPISVTVSPVCLGKVYTVTATGASTYQFSYFAPTTANTFTAIPSFTQAQYFSVNGTANNGCMTSSTFSFAAAPLVSLNTGSITNYAMCLNGQVTMTVAGANTYSWSNGATGSLVTVSPLVSSNYTVFGTSSNGCTTNSLGLAVTVINPPTVTISPASLSVCPNSFFTLNASAGAGYYIANWSDGTNSAQLTSSIIAATIYTVSMSNTICTSSQTIQVNLFNPSTLSLSSSALCSGMSNNLSYTATPVGGTLFVNGFPGSTIYANSASIYTVSYRYQDTGMCVLSSQSLITVNSAPCVKLIADKYLVCEGGQITLTGTPSGGTYFGTNASSNILSVGAAGSYTTSYSYMDVNGCSSIACLELMADVCEGLKYQYLQDLKLYPNPTEELVTIENPSKEKLIFHVYDITGRIIYSDELTNSINTISLKEYPQGIYVFQLQNKSEFKSLKVIKN